MSFRSKRLTLALASFAFLGVVSAAQAIAPKCSDLQAMCLKRVHDARMGNKGIDANDIDYKDLEPACTNAYTDAMRSVPHVFKANGMPKQCE